MTAIRLSTIRVEKPWGRCDLWPGFANPSPGQAPIGEIWFDAPAGHDPDLMVKYLFTSQRLSIQVHPDDAAAQTCGHARGKDEAWVILAAEPGATIALGTRYPVTREELRAAAQDGSIETLMHWQSVKAGDVIYSPAGVIHAIGPGLTLIEVQQNLDLTYRLYDYGRPRELHLDDGIAVSNPVPFVWQDQTRVVSSGRHILTEGGKFVIERWTGVHNYQTSAGWFIPVTGAGTIEDAGTAGSAAWAAGECWLVDGGGAKMTLNPGSTALFAYTGHSPRAD